MSQKNAASGSAERRTVGAMEVVVDGEEVSLIRLFDAPRELVFKAWTDPTHISKWWGPSGFDVPECRLDPLPGTTYRIVMRSPQGSEMHLTGVIHEVEEPERIVMTLGSDGTAFEVLMTIVFEEVAGKTKMTLTTMFGSLAERDAATQRGANDGWAQSFEKLDAHLAGAKVSRLD
ncbi:MAG: SRPBCC domain-containing protein [Trueperaceae bacterium]